MTQPSGAASRPGLADVALHREHEDLRARLEHTNALLAEETVLLEAIARGLPMESVLEQLSRLIERHVEGGRCSVGVLEPDGVVRHHSAVLLPPEIIAFLDHTDPSSELGQSLRMVDTELVVYDDIASDPRWAEGRRLVLANGLASCWTLTVNASGTAELLGVVAVFHPERRGPDDAELPLLERCRALAAIAIERRRVEARLEHQALHDSLTGLPNRTLVFDRIEQALARGRRRQGGIAVLFVDLDRFKLINDSLGHAAGDQVLEQVADRFTATVRAGDTVGRFGGDEFVVVCEDVDGEPAARHVGDRLRRSLAPPFSLGVAEVEVTASVGIVLANEASTPESLIRDADAAMYRAKERGRNQCALADRTGGGRR